jgi:hypothetical protein
MAESFLSGDPTGVVNRTVSANSRLGREAVGPGSHEH